MSEEKIKHGRFEIQYAGIKYPTHTVNILLSGSCIHRVVNPESKEFAIRDAKQWCKYVAKHMSDTNTVFKVKGNE